MKSIFLKRFAFAFPLFCSLVTFGQQFEQVATGIPYENSLIHFGHTELYDSKKDILYLFSATEPNGHVVLQKLKLNWETPNHSAQALQQAALFQPTTNHFRPYLRNTLSIGSYKGMLFLYGATFEQDNIPKVFYQKLDSNTFSQLVINDAHRYSVRPDRLMKSNAYPLEGVADNRGTYFYGTFPEGALFRFDQAGNTLRKINTSDGDPKTPKYCYYMDLLNPASDSSMGYLSARVGQSIVFTQYSPVDEEVITIWIPRLKVGQTPVKSLSTSPVLYYNDSGTPVFCSLGTLNDGSTHLLELDLLSVFNKTNLVKSIYKFNHSVSGDLLRDSKGHFHIVSEKGSIEIIPNSESELAKSPLEGHKPRWIQDVNALQPTNYLLVAGEEVMHIAMENKDGFRSMPYPLKAAIEGETWKGEQVSPPLETGTTSQGGSQIRTLAAFEGSMLSFGFHQYSHFSTTSFPPDNRIGSGRVKKEVYSFARISDQVLVTGQYWNPQLQVFDFSSGTLQLKEPINLANIQYQQNGKTYNTSPRMKAMVTADGIIYAGTSPSAYNAYGSHRGFLIRYDPTQNIAHEIGIIRDTTSPEVFMEGIESLVYYDNKSGDRFIFGGTGDVPSLFQYSDFNNTSLQEIAPTVFFQKGQYVTNLRIVEDKDKTYLCGLLKGGTFQFFRVEINDQQGLLAKTLYTQKIEGAPSHMVVNDNQLYIINDEKLYYCNLSGNTVKLQSLPQAPSGWENSVLVEDGYLYVGTIETVEDGKNGNGGRVYRTRLNKVSGFRKALSLFW